MSNADAVKILKLIKSTVYLGNRKLLDALDYAAKVLSMPERKTGRWIQDKHEIAGYGYFDCSECGADFYDVDGFKYCPNCGAKMEVEQCQK